MLGGISLIAAAPLSNFSISEGNCLNDEYPLYRYDSDGTLCRWVRVNGTAMLGDLMEWTERKNEVRLLQNGSLLKIAGSIYSETFANGYAWLCIKNF
jgi:hypothetical protein